MMYQDKLVAAIKVNGKILREQKEEVKIPFGSEYSIYLKNLNSVKCKVKIEIDGVDISDGSSFIIEPNDTLDVERFIRNGNMHEGNRFKFIERTEKVEDNRGGIQLEDGLIRIEFEFEQKKTEVHRIDYIDHYYHRPRYWDHYWEHRPWYNGAVCTTLGRAVTSGAVSNGFTASDVKLQASQQTTASYNSKSIGASNFAGASLSNSDGISSSLQNDAGITAPGSRSDQTFSYGYFGVSDGVKHTMTFKLLGAVGEKKVERPITVKTKAKCPICGTDNAPNAKFCTECGSACELI